MTDDASAEQQPVVCVPERFLVSLGQSTDLTELKLVLLVLRLSVGRGTVPVPMTDLLDLGRTRSVTGPHTPEPVDQRMKRAIDGAVANGYLVRLEVVHDTEIRPYLLPATEAGLALAARLQAADGAALRAAGLMLEDRVHLSRPNVFALYERYMGPLTPLLAEQLRDAERLYPRGWIDEAIRLAAERKKRSWRYIDALLTRWEATGAPDTVPGTAAEDPRE